VVFVRSVLSATKYPPVLREVVDNIVKHYSNVTTPLNLTGILRNISFPVNLSVNSPNLRIVPDSVLANSISENVWKLYKVSQLQGALTPFLEKVFAPNDNSHATALFALIFKRMSSLEQKVLSIFYFLSCSYSIDQLINYALLLVGVDACGPQRL
jgi:hypothetical protein